MKWFDIFAGSSSGQAFQIAAEEEQRLYDEEEGMTPYSDEELNEDWEFKILRSATSVFKKPQNLQEILDQEAKAGWTLVEKFDDQRIRLKRPASARRDDRGLSFDPYRTQIGISGKAVSLMAVCLVMAVVIAVVATIAYLKG